MTFTNARNTSHDPTSATPALHRQRQQVLNQHVSDQRREPVRQHVHLAKQHRSETHQERIRLGSSLNGLDRVLEPARRRAFLASALE